MPNQAEQEKIEELIQFIEGSPTAYQAVYRLKEIFLENQFQELDPDGEWSLKLGGRYFVASQGSTMAAFTLPKENITKACILGTHTDSPSFKLKPQPEFIQGNMVMLGAEIYGGPLLSSWLNRDLGIAGRIFYRNKSGEIVQSLVDIADQPCVIPQLAIHLDRGVNDTGLILNKENHLSAIACLLKDSTQAGSYLRNLLADITDFETLLSHDLFFYPLDAPRYLGQDNEMLAGYRLDNLCSVHAAAKGLIENSAPKSNQLKMAIFWDNEEIGSGTTHGAESPFLPHLLERIMIACMMHRDEYLRLLSRSLCVSIDLAHAMHPNYPEKHEKQHQPLLNKGIVIKFNAQQRYASNGATAAIIADACDKLKLPLQKFVMRNDMPCGSTIGPITAALTGIPTVDIGIPQLSMHSCRELIGCQDHLDMCKLLSFL